MTYMQRFTRGPVTPFTGLFDEVFRDFGYSTSWSTARAQVEETEEAFLIHCDMPGVDPKGVSVTLEGDTLSIKGSREGRRSASYAQAYTVPKGVAQDQVEASYEHGVLTVRLPKLAEAKARVIEVKVV